MFDRKTKTLISILVIFALALVLVAHQDATACGQTPVCPSLAHVLSQHSDTDDSQEDRHSREHCSQLCQGNTFMTSAPLPLEIAVIPILTVENPEPFILQHINSSIYRPPRIV